jgi:hypothetical protein
LNVPSPHLILRVQGILFPIYELYSFADRKSREKEALNHPDFLEQLLIHQPEPGRFVSDKKRKHIDKYKLYLIELSPNR